MDRKTVAVLFGGASNEYEVSLRSAVSVLENLDEKKYEVLKVGISREGRWFLFDGPLEQIAGDSWQEGGFATPAVLSPDRRDHGLVLMAQGCYTKRWVDVVFPVLHGKNGEDGTVQGLLELAGIPYVGCGVAASSCCMDKALTHTLLRQAGVPQCRSIAVREDELEDFAALQWRLSAELGYPMFIKPANAGSSVGISRVEDQVELRTAFALAFAHDSKLVAEEAVDGLELECAVLGNEQPVASIVGEIEPVTHAFYDYEAKYQDDSTKLYIPARIAEEKALEIREMAVRAYRVMGCSGLARVDFFLRRHDEAVILNEINTLPGFTSISMYPKLFIHSGIGYPQLLDRLLELALQKAPNKI